MNDDAFHLIICDFHRYKTTKINDYSETLSQTSTLSLL